MTGILYSLSPTGPWYDPAGTTSGRDWSLEIECSQIADMALTAHLRKDVRLLYPWATPRLDGRWPVVSGSLVVLAWLDTAFDAGMVKAITVSEKCSHVRVGENLLSLGGGWVLGPNGVTALSGKRVLKTIDVNAAPAGADLDIVRHMNIDLAYPWETISLDGSWTIGIDGKLYALDGSVMDGSWAAGGVGLEVVHGVLAQKDAFCTAGITKDIEMFSSRAVVALGETCLKLDGAWGVGVNSAMTFMTGRILKDPALNGKWAVSGANDILLSAAGWRTQI